MASFLKLLAQTLFGYEFKSLELNQLHPPGKGSLGEGDLFGGEGVMAILSKYANFPLLYRRGGNLCYLFGDWSIFRAN